MNYLSTKDKSQVYENLLLTLYFGKGFGSFYVGNIGRRHYEGGLTGFSKSFKTPFFKRY